MRRSIISQQTLVGLHGNSSSPTLYYMQKQKNYSLHCFRNVYFNSILTVRHINRLECCSNQQSSFYSWHKGLWQSTNKGMIRETACVHNMKNAWHKAGQWLLEAVDELWGEESTCIRRIQFRSERLYVNMNIYSAILLQLYSTVRRCFLTCLCLHVVSTVDNGLLNCGHNRWQRVPHRSTFECWKQSSQHLLQPVVQQTVRLTFKTERQ